MFSFRLHNHVHSRRFIIAHADSAGWDVREELNSEPIRVAWYLDWHRVERARRQFERQIADLRSRGWIEA